MKVTYAILADAAETTRDGKLTMMGGEIDTINVPTFPAVHFRLALAVKLQAEPQDRDSGRFFHLDLKSPDGNSLLQGIDIALPAPIPVADRPEQLGAYLFVVNFPPLVFPWPGKYEMNLIVDGERLMTLPLYLKQSSPSP